jgi:prophage regulatory protein
MGLTFFSDKDLADRYRVHRSTIWRWIKEGRFPQPVKISPGCSRFSKDQVVAHEAKLQNQN